MWKFCLTMLLMCVTAQAGQNTVISEYTIIANSQVGYYHYPAPPKSQQLHTPEQIFPSKQTGRYQTTQQNSNYNNYYRSSTAGIHKSPAVTKQFNSAALDNAAFALALTSQGYKTAASSNAAPRFLTTQSKSSSSSVTPDISLSPSSSSSSSPSLNVRLPLPFGVTPLNIATLPLQGGTPYSSIPKGVTSYGTIDPQRKRR